MKHRATPDFWSCYRRLPKEVQGLADRAFELLKSNPLHPSLHFKKVGRLWWSVRIGLRYRALAAETSDGLLWFWVGTHSEYDALVG